MEQHLFQPTKVHIMIQAFTTTLVKDIGTLNDNIALHEEDIQ